MNTGNGTKVNIVCDNGETLQIKKALFSPIQKQECSISTDVTAKVRSMVNCNRLSLFVSPQNLGIQERCVHAHKQLSIDYKCAPPPSKK
jgi:hypothetical protein